MFRQLGCVRCREKADVACVHLPVHRNVRNDQGGSDGDSVIGGPTTRSALKMRRLNHCGPCSNQCHLVGFWNYSKCIYRRFEPEVCNELLERVEMIRRTKVFLLAGADERDVAQTGVLVQDAECACRRRVILVNPELIADYKKPPGKPVAYAHGIRLGLKPFRPEVWRKWQRHDRR